MSPEQFVVGSYVVYLVVSIAATIWVARTLFKNGRPFLVDAFDNNQPLADSINHLLVVGFYLINAGYVTLALKYGDKPVDTQSAVEFVSTKIGLVLLILGMMHFFNLHVFATLRKRGLAGELSAHGAPALAGAGGTMAALRERVGRPASSGGDAGGGTNPPGPGAGAGAGR